MSDMPPTKRDHMEIDDDSARDQVNGFLPAGVAQVPKEELQKYLKCKRIGNYLLGKTIGEGSFARVKQGFHVLTGEKVGNQDVCEVIYSNTKNQNRAGLKAS